MGMIFDICYVSVGILLSLFFWRKYYKEDYDKAKESGEGVEDGMAVLLLLFMVFFWPLILIYKGLVKWTEK